MENRVISEIFSKKDVGTFYQKSVGNPIHDVVEAQFAYSNQMSKSFNPIKSKPNLPKEVSNLVTVSQGDIVVSPSGDTEEEISKAIFQLDRDKALGPDGFTIAVFQDCWDVIKEDLVRVFAEFHRSRIINQSTNASFIVLLPKKSLTKKISDFRPISLITSLYKIIAKVLSGRLRGVLHETIHYTQGAFVQGRQILDAVLIANEIVDEKRHSGEEGVVLKIDFEKRLTIM